MTLALHQLGRPPSERMVSVHDELGFSYAVPIGAAPVIADGDVVPMKSGATLDRILVRHGGGRHSGTPLALQGNASGNPSPPRHRSNTDAAGITSHPSIRADLARISAGPGYRRVMAKGDPAMAWIRG